MKIESLSPKEHPIRFAIMMVLLGMAVDRYVLPDKPKEEIGGRRGAITGTLNSAEESEGESPAEPEAGSSGQRSGAEDDQPPITRFSRQISKSRR